jgi:hypothetical protein
MEVHSASAPVPFAGYFDLNNPLSLYSKLGKENAEKFHKVLSELPEAEGMLHDETVLKTWLRDSHQFKPTVAENRYRYQFWLEYENSIREERQMRMTNVYYFVGQESTFRKLILEDARRLAWMLCRPAGYESTAREMLQFGMSKLRQYLERDPFENPDKPNMKLLEMQYKITAMMDMRLHGAPTQKLQQLTVNATLGANGEIKGIEEKGDMEVIKRKLEDLRERKRKLEGRVAEPAQPAASPAPGGVIDAEVVEVVEVEK